MTEFLNELSENQINYLKQQKEAQIHCRYLPDSDSFQFSLSLGIHCKCRYHRLLSSLAARQRLHYVSGAWCWIKAFFCTPMLHYMRQS